MLTIETKGTWREMGRQVGETFRKEFARCFDRFCPWLLAAPGRYASAIAAVREQVASLAPEIVEETEGMAEGADCDATLLFGYRFMNDVRLGSIREGCTVIWLDGGDAGPLLGRNCDLEPDISQEIQLLHSAHPVEGPAVVNSSYLGMVNGAGMNAYGLCAGGASAHTNEEAGTAKATAGALLQYLLLHRCRTLGDAGRVLMQHTFSGKPLNILAADREGGSQVIELAPGRPPVRLPRSQTRTWQACTNFFLSGRIAIAPEPTYLENAYARYGRIAHQLDGQLVPHTVDALKQLLADVAQPGLCNTGRDGKALTAYSLILEPATGRVHYTSGHPTQNAWHSIEIHGLA